MTPPESVQHNVYCALPAPMRRRSLVSAELTYSAAPAPRTSALPRWLTSNSPTVVRVAVCSLTVPAYDTGISQPENSAKLAPSSRWRPSRGPCWTSLASASRTGNHPSVMVDPDTLVRVVDLDALEAAGIADVRERAGLIASLDGLGFTAADMVEAERRGRLFGLAGDVLQWSHRRRGARR